MSKRIYALNDKVFDTINRNSAYWIGFLYGDGNCTCQNKIRLALSWSDRDHLIKFRDFLQTPDRPIKEVVTEYGHNASIELRSWKLHNILKKYELTKRKDHRGYVHIDLLQDSIVSDFVRGIFDADGCFYYDGLHKNNLFAEITGRKPLMKSLKQVLVRHNIINDKKKIVKNGSIFRIRLAKQDTLKLVAFLYKDNPRYFLKWKYGIAKCYLDRLNESTKQQSK